MTVNQLLGMDIGSKTGGFTLDIKTAKKKWQLADQTWVQQVLLTDATGDILADVKLGGYTPLSRDSLIHIIVCEIQPTDTGKKLFIDQWDIGGATSEPPSFAEDEYQKSIRGKIKHGLIAAYLQAGNVPSETLEFARSEEIKQIIQSIMNA